jgi:ketosteroid isomerase-like protein
VTLSAADRLDILDLLTRADAAAGARDADAYLALFTGDAVLDGDQGDYRGADALRAGLAAVWGAEPAGTVHLTLNPVIDAGPAPADTAVARTVLLIIAPGPPPALVHTANVTQHLRRGPDGWRITHRTVGTGAAQHAAAIPPPTTTRTRTAEEA